MEMLLLPPPSAPHPLPQTAPVVEQAHWWHLSWPSPAGFGGSTVQSTPAEQLGAPLASCPSGSLHPSTNSTSTQGLAGRCWESSATLARVLLGTSGSGDIRATLTAATHDAQGASQEPSWLSDPGGNIPNAVSHVRNNSWPPNHPWGPKMPPPVSWRNGVSCPRLTWRPGSTPRTARTS